MTLALVSTIIYCIAITLINQLFEIRSYNIYLVCLMGLMGTKSIEQNFLYIQLTILLPMMTLVFITCLIDFYCIVWYRKQTNLRTDQENERNSNTVNCMPFINDIPIKATLLSTIFLVLVLAVFIILGIRDIGRLENYLAVILITRINDTLRNPMVAICTFRINDDNRAQQNAEVERERRRQEVIQLALKRRQQRESKRQGNTRAKSKSGFSEDLETKEVPKVEMKEIMPRVELKELPRVEC